MKTKNLLIILPTFVLAVGTLYANGVGNASAISSNASVTASINVGTASTTIHGNATSSAAMNRNNSSSTGTSTRGNATSTAAKNKNTSSSSDGKTMSETHRSVVATFVQSLRDVADRDGGIGQEVRVVAKTQNDSAATTTPAIVKIENRGSFRTFLFGSDYKNLGVIRSEIATTTANLARLKTLLVQTSNDIDRAELTLQINALEAEQVKLNTYVKTYQEKFSLFGWFNRLFVK